jgi:hypothetical protein
MPGQGYYVIDQKNKEKFTVEITPVKTASGSYKIGAWIRDNTQGIGTLILSPPMVNSEHSDMVLLMWIRDFYWM